MVLLRQMIVFFIMMIIGYFLAHKEIFDAGTCKKISWFIINVCSPAMVINSALGEERVEGKMFLYVMEIAILMYIVLIILGIVMPLILKKRDAAIYSVMTVFGNIGFMGYPLVEEMYGRTGLLYAMIFNMFFNLLIYTYGISVISGKKFSITNMKQIMNVGVGAVILTFILYFTNPSLPDFLTDAIGDISALTGPLSMMMIGASFVEFHFAELFSDLRLLLFTGIRFLIFPVIFMIVARPFIQDSVVLGVCLVMVSAPVGSMNLLLAQQYDGDIATASRAIAVTTVLSVVIMPCLSLIFLI